jgi:plastocyanin
LVRASRRRTAVGRKTIRLGLSEAKSNKRRLSMKLTHALVAALALAAPAAAAQPTNVVPIHLYSYGYAPSPIVLRAGVPVTLVFQNVSGSGHTFKAPAFFASSKMMSGMTMQGEVHVMPHKSMSVTVIPARGTYPVHCSHFFHDQLGMHSVIYVQ